LREDRIRLSSRLPNASGFSRGDARDARGTVGLQALVGRHPVE
jgi:hypothetical protein